MRFTRTKNKYKIRRIAKVVLTSVFKAVDQEVIFYFLRPFFPTHSFNIISDHGKCQHHQTIHDGITTMAYLAVKLGKFNQQAHVMYIDALFHLCLLTFHCRRPHCLNCTGLLGKSTVAFTDRHSCIKWR